MDADDDDKREALDRITELLLETKRAAHAVEDDFLSYLLGIALLHVAEERAEITEAPMRRLVS